MPPKVGAVERVDKRARSAKHYRNPDGTYSAVFSTGAMHYQATPQGEWLDKKHQFRAGATNEWISDESDVTMRTFSTGGNRQWWIEFKETLSGRGIQFRIPVQPVVTEGSSVVSFSEGWTYTHTKAGGKLLGPPTSTSKGPQNFVIPYVLLPGTPAFVEEADGSVNCPGVFRMGAPRLVGADGLSYSHTSWTIDAGTLSFAYDDTNLPASAYPYQVDPTTTFSVSTDTDDGYVRRADSTYATVPNFNFFRAMSTEVTAFAGRYFDSGSSFFFVQNQLFRWDTSSLSDAANILGAQFRAYFTAPSNADTRNYTGGYSAWDGTSDTDWVMNAETGAFSTAISSITGAAYNTIALTAPNANISKTGPTYIRTHVDGGQPTGMNQVETVTYEHTTFDEPRLLVDYSEPSFIQVGADGTGKKKRTQTHTVDTQTVHTGYDIVTADTVDAQAPVLNTMPATGDYGLSVRAVAPSRTQMLFQVSDLQGNTTEALQTLTPVVDFTTGTGAATFTVTTGKTFVVSHLGIQNRSNAATAFWALANLRVNTGGTVTATSPIALTSTLPYRSVAAAAANFGSFDEVWYPGGLWIPSGASWGVSFVSSSGTAVRLRFDIYLTGWEV